MQLMDGEEPYGWLHGTRALQENYFGVNYEKLTGDELADYLCWNIAAAHDEIGEFAHEVGWKPWAKSRGWVNKEDARNELVDVLHFVANMLVAIGVTDQELDDAYLLKMETNRRRMIEGYTGRS